MVVSQNIWNSNGWPARQLRTQHGVQICKQELNLWVCINYISQPNVHSHVISYYSVGLMMLIPVNHVVFVLHLLRISLQLRMDIRMLCPPLSRNILISLSEKWLVVSMWMEAKSQETNAEVQSQWFTNRILVCACTISLHEDALVTVSWKFSMVCWGKKLSAHLLAGRGVAVLPQWNMQDIVYSIGAFAHPCYPVSSRFKNRNVHVPQALQPQRPHIESLFSFAFIKMDCARLRAILISSFKEEARDHKLLQAVLRSWNARDPVQIVEACPVCGTSRSFSPPVLKRWNLYVCIYKSV